MATPASRVRNDDEATAVGDVERASGHLGEVNILKMPLTNFKLTAFKAAPLLSHMARVLGGGYHFCVVHK